MLRSRRRERPTTLRRDGIRWDIKPSSAPIVAVGDIHGDLAGLACILRERRIITKKGRWKGGYTQLVLTGDLTGGRDARPLHHFVIRLQSEATAAGGGVQALLGNHDIRTLQTTEGVSIFSGEALLGSWLRRRNTVI